MKIAVMVACAINAAKGIKKALHAPDIKRVRHGIIGEPTDFKPAIVQKGVCSIKIKTCGVAAHGAFPTYGLNAIEKMYPILSQIKKLDFSEDIYPLVEDRDLCRKHRVVLYDERLGHPVHA